MVLTGYLASDQDWVDIGIDVGGGQGIGHDGGAGNDRTVVEMAGFCDRAGGIGRGIGDDRNIVGAVDGDGDGLFDPGAVVIGDARGVGLIDTVAFLERLGGGEAVVEGVGPHAGGRVEDDGAVGGADGAFESPVLC